VFGLVGVATTLRTGRSGVRISVGAKRPDRLWGPPSFLFSGVLFRGVKWPGSDAEHSPPSSVEVKNEWNYTSTSPMPSWR
jgi:hypothetical protein